MNKIMQHLSSPRRSTRDLSMNILGISVLSLLFTIINPNFINKFNLVSIGQTFAPYAMLSLGVLMPISMGGTDLSVGALCIGSAVVAGKLYALGLPLGLTIPVMLLFGALIGLINGYLIAKKHLQPFIATLGSMMFVRGITAIFANTATVLYPSGTWYNSLFSSCQGIPVSFAWVMLFAGILYFIYRKTRMGRYFISIGSSEKATRISGVDVEKYTMLGYLGSGLMAGVAAVFYTASFATVTVATGNGMELDAIAGVYIGGTSAVGGLANVFGAVIGAVMLVIIRSGLNFALARLNVPINSTYVTYVISGVIVIASVLAEKSKVGSSGKRKTPEPQKRAVRRLTAYGLSVVLLCILVVIGVNHGKILETVIADDTQVKKTVCLVVKSENNEFWADVRKGAEQAGEDLNSNILFRGPEIDDASSLPQQRQIVSTMLADNPDGLGIVAVADGFTDLLEEAYDRGVPVVQFDSGLRDKDREEIAKSEKNPLRAYVNADNYQNASLAAEKTFEAVYDDMLAADGDYIVGIIQFSTNQTAADRAAGFKETFEKLAAADERVAGKCRVLLEIKPSEANNAYKEALEFLFEKGVDLVFCTNLNAVNQCADAVSAAGGKYDGVKFVGFDTGEKLFEWLNSDSASPLIGTISQNPQQIGYLTVQTMLNIAEGKKVESEVIVPGEWVSKSNADKR